MRVEICNCGLAGESWTKDFDVSIVGEEEAIIVFPLDAGSFRCEKVNVACGSGDSWTVLYVAESGDSWPV